MDDEETELRNPFPSPPSCYTHYTTHNLALLQLLRERAGPDADLGALNQYEVLSDQQDVPEYPVAQLEKPRVDWIMEEGSYTVFKDKWLIKESIPSLAEAGGHQLYPEDPTVDRRPALRSILRSLLVSYSKLLSSLLAPPPTASSQTEPEWRTHLEWINVLSLNILGAANDLRPVQARANLELMMRRQLELRREETKAIHAKCDALEVQLAALRAASQEESLAASQGAASAQSTQATILSSIPSQQSPDPGNLSMEDVLRWAEEVA
ncbi:MED7 protein-domain-containing protein [Epithele typhae]|uniref:MED7 protein-domain-containing protein n=1 Tax=Epithele typhae TaxID=378194 RepID=UPI0020074526|nr:MED7 protein-domain-containing protein [Epithele typhae]KAH9927964.1 MED7 protein-domain-containing protein [Epithele typhae]